MQSQAKLSHELEHLQGKEQFNYFTCTLGQAAASRAEHSTSYGTINDLFDEQCKEIPQQPAVGFPNPPRNKELWTYQVFSKCTSSTFCAFQPSAVRIKMPYDFGWRCSKVSKRRLSSLVISFCLHVSL